MIDGGTDAGRGEMKRGVALTWRCNAPLARDLTGTWAAAAAATLIANKVSICQSAFIGEQSCSGEQKELVIFGVDFEKVPFLMEKEKQCIQCLLVDCYFIF